MSELSKKQKDRKAYELERKYITERANHIAENSIYKTVMYERDISEEDKALQNEWLKTNKVKDFTQDFPKD